MSTDVELVERVRGVLAGRPGMTERRMFGGLAFLEHGHILVAVSRASTLLVRVASSADRDALLRDDPAHVKPMVMGSKEVRRFVYVDARGVATQDALRAWIARSSHALRSDPPLKVGRTRKAARRKP